MSVVPTTATTMAAVRERGPLIESVMIESSVPLEWRMNDTSLAPTREE
jgi:hypothetical protein